MKITKVDGVSHKKFEEKGKLLKKGDENDVIEERLKNLLRIRLDKYIKKPVEVNDSKLDETQKENKKRRKELQKIFSQMVITKENGSFKINRIKKHSKNDAKETQEIYMIDGFVEYDLKNPYNSKGESIFEVFKRILLSEESEKDLQVFEGDFKFLEDRIIAIKKSLQENKAHYLKEKYDVKGNNKRSIVYEYYKKFEKYDEYLKNIEEAFNILYTREDIEELFKVIEEIKKHEKYKVREKYHEILDKNKTRIDRNVYTVIQESENIKKFIEKNSDVGELTKSQIFYKYFLEKENLDNESVKNIFCHFVEIEVSNLLKENVYKDKKYNKVENIFEYEKLKNLVKNKLSNKLRTYVRNCGKYNYYLCEDEIATSEFISGKRQNEGFLRNIIGVSSAAYFSLRNILESDNNEDIINKMKGKNVKNKEGKEEYRLGEVDKIYEHKKENEVKNNLKMFYGTDFNMKNKEEITEFFVNIDEAIGSIRHGIFHFNDQLKAENIFLFEDLKPSKIVKNIFEREIDDRILRLKVFRQLNSANVFDYYKDRMIHDYLARMKFGFTNKNIPFIPSFTKLYSRIKDLKRSLEIGGKWEIPDRKEKKDAQIYLLKNIYYGEFLNYFMNNKNKFFEVKDEIIRLNKEDSRNVKTGFYKLEKFEKLKADSPKEYLAEVQSLYMINNEKVQEEDEKNVFLDFIQKIFLKGFFEYLRENGLLSLMYIKTEKNGIEELKIRKDRYDKLLKQWENDGENLNKMPDEISKFVKEIKIKSELKSTDRMCMLYLILKLLNHKELTGLKGNLEKYRASNESGIFSEELQLINFVNLDNNKMTEDFELLPEEVGKFLETGENKIKELKELKQFDNYGIYSDGKNIIRHRAFYNIKKYGMLDLLEKIVEKAQYKVTKDEIKECKEKEDRIKENYENQAELHLKYQKKPKQLTDKKNIKDYEKYEKAIKNIERYTHLKNKIEFNDLNLLQSLLLKILHRLAGYTSIWERDLKFNLKGEFPENLYIDEIFNFDNSKNTKYKNGQIVEKYTSFLVEREEERLQESFSKNKRKKLKEKYRKELSLDIRNYIAHFNYIPKAEYSILEILEKLRKLLSYDRKLKNAVMKSVKNILEEYGFESKFKIGLDKKIKVEGITSKEIKHLSNKNLKTRKNSKELCNLIKVMFEYKCSSSKSN